jgi:ABC-2 type transport system ATP-binding protein
MAPPESSALAELRNVSKRFGEHVGLEGVSLEVLPGEVIGLLGPNGAGKTTSVRILCGALEPSSGQAFIGGYNVALDPVLARRKLAFVPEGAPLYDTLTARSHLHLVGRLHGLSEDFLKRESERLLERFDLGDRADDPVGQFSRGMRQKTALACAVLARPALLVLDEPLSGLDAPTAAVVKELLREWAERGGAVLYTSHLLDVVERVCTRMAILAHGKLIASGTLEELRGQSGSDGTLEQVFRAVTHAEDPREKAKAILGAEPRP